MARKSTSLLFKNAIICMEDMTITEISKETSVEHGLMEILKEWDGINGVSVSIKKDSEYGGTDTEDGD